MDPKTDYLNNLIVGSKEQILRDTLIDHLPAQIFWKNQDLIYLGCNTAFLHSLGLKSKKDVIGKSDFDLPVSKKDSLAYRADDMDVITSGQAKLNIEERQVLKDGTERVLSTSKVPLFDEAGHLYGVLAIYIDITERKKIEEDLRIAKEAAEAASRAKSEFIANMGHDIRTPLTGIIGMSHILEEELEHPEKKAHAAIIHSSGEQLLNLLNGVLDLITVDASTEDTLSHESFDVRQLIYDLVDLERPAVMAKQLEIVAVVDTAIPDYVIGDKTKLHRVLLNLIGNAIKFTQSGQIEVSVKLAAINGHDVSVTCAVKDTGIGIPEALQGKVFDRFFKVNPSYKGLYTGNGIGLHIVQKYVGLLGGEIHLTSEVKVGTAFTFTLPLQLGERPEIELQQFKKSEAPPEDSLSDAHHIHSMNVLLVEDNAPALKVLEILLKEHAVQVYTAVNAESALDLIKSQRFDLIITDLGLPGLSGDDMTVAIRAHEKEQGIEPTHIVGLTGHALKDITTACMNAGMNEVYRKPISSDALKTMMTRLQQSTHHTLVQQKLNGVDLPEHEHELFEIEQYPILDINLAIQNLGNESLVAVIFKDLMEHGILDDLALIRAAFDLDDWQTIEMLTHKMKGGACYGTVRLYYALLYLERYIKAGYTLSRERLYQQMLSVINDTMRSLETWLGLTS